ncbi:DNA polymerase I [Eggerthellaceae bacterium zg-893]|nr:DNA polymerase I [Eggerthellaceae bacterium zg-893]
MAKKIAVIDGNSLMHRAFHAVDSPMNTADGTPTNAVFGFMAMFLKFVDLAHPDAVVCAFDAGIPEFRKTAIEGYKAQRPPMDPDLRVQFPIIEDLLESMNVPVVRISGWEGDDILGTIAARDEALGYETLLVTGDRDAFQLASDLTRIVATKRGITDVAVYGPDEVLARYGVTPAQVPDFLGLKGDSSDNIPGVPGVGEKTAAKLLRQYGSLEGLYEHTDELKGKQKERIEENRDAAFGSRQVATIVRDLDFPLDLEGAAFPSFDSERVKAAFEKVQFNAQLARVLKLAGEEVPPEKEAALVDAPVCEGAQASELLDAALARGERVSAALGVRSPGELFETQVCAVGTSQGVGLFEGDEALRVLSLLVRTAPFAALDVKELVHAAYPADTSKPAVVSDAELMAMDAFDLGLAAYALNSSVSEYTLAKLAEKHLGGVLPEVEDPTDALVQQAAAAFALVEPLTRALADDGSDAAYFDIDLPLVAVLAIMERTGAAIDSQRMRKLDDYASGEIAGLAEQIYALAGETFNIDSPKQLAAILFDKLGLPPLKKNQRGYSTDATVLTELAKDHEIPGLVIRYRELSKIKKTYIDTLPKTAAAAGDGRLHTTFHETVTSTGRLSSSDPNLQNIPVRTDFGRQIRDCFVPLRDGDEFVSADYSQIELRLLAHLSQDEKLLEAFNSGADFHAATASHVFGIPLEGVTPEMRSRAKAVNFGIVYGQQAFGLSQSLGIPFQEAKEMIERYFEAYPGVRTFLDDTVEHARQRGFAETMFGRKRHIPELKSRNANQRGFGERTAMNHPMQGSAADIIKKAMREVQQRLMDEGFQAKLMLQVHDELDFSCPTEEVERLSAMVREVMMSVASCDVELEVDVGVGPTWADAH